MCYEEAKTKKTKEVESEGGKVYNILSEANKGTRNCKDDARKSLICWVTPTSKIKIWSSRKKMTFKNLDCHQTPKNDRILILLPTTLLQFASPNNSVLRWLRTEFFDVGEFSHKERCDEQCTSKSQLGYKQTDNVSCKKGKGLSLIRAMIDVSSRSECQKRNFRKYSLVSVFCVLIIVSRIWMKDWVYQSSYTCLLLYQVLLYSWLRKRSSCKQVLWENECLWSKTWERYEWTYITNKDGWEWSPV